MCHYSCMRLWTHTIFTLPQPSKRQKPYLHNSLQPVHSLLAFHFYLLCFYFLHFSTSCLQNKNPFSTLRLTVSPLSPPSYPFHFCLFCRFYIQQEGLGLGLTVAVALFFSKTRRLRKIGTTLQFWVRTGTLFHTFVHARVCFCRSGCVAVGWKTSPAPG